MNPVETQTVADETRLKPLLAGNSGLPLRRVWLKLFAFLLPVLFIVGPAIYWVDPFNFFPKESPVSRELRKHYAVPLNSILWNVLAYARDPKPNIVLGDSQVASIPEGQISLASGVSYANLGAGGSTLRESIDLFWLASRETKLRNVYFGVNFQGYNAYPQDRVPRAEAILKDPVLYFLNSEVIEAGAYDIGDAVFHHRTNLGPHESRDVFWQTQIHFAAEHYKRIMDPGDLRDQLRQVADYARAHGIAFVFLIPPKHVDVQREVATMQVEGEYARFKSDLAAIAPVYDCDVDNSFTRDKDNFLDPFHLNESAAKQLASDIWSGRPTLCRTLGGKH
jgi:hypothetical protein